ncbi:MAG: purine-binding chemotaxis protein CheW [Lysobacteraceae bacterium]|nr:MAG: purine-binding chemotaxis protein CheW [Xanthomonadaceae bacterium]
MRWWPASTSWWAAEVNVTGPFEVLADYERRSLAHVAGLPEQLDAPGLWRGVGFRVGHSRLAAGFDEVVEILPMPQVTPVPGAQPWMLGVANVRGNLLPIVDLKQFLEGERTVLHEGQRVLIVRQPGGDVAVTIDELFGQRSFNDEQQLPAEDREGLEFGTGRYVHFVDRIYRLGEDDWGVFSLQKLARTPEFRQAAA